MLESIQIAYSLLFNRNSVHENMLQKQARISTSFKVVNITKSQSLLPIYVKFCFKVVKCKRTLELLAPEHQVNQGPY